MRAELKAIKADDAFRKRAESEAKKIMRGRKSLDDLSAFPGLREAVEKILEKPENLISAESYADPLLKKVVALCTDDREKTGGFLDLRESDNILWIHLPAVLEMTDGKVNLQQLYTELRQHPAYLLRSSHRFAKKVKGGWCFIVSEL